MSFIPKLILATAFGMIMMSEDNDVDGASISMIPPTFPEIDLFTSNEFLDLADQDFTSPFLVRCYCNTLECLEATDGVPTCTSSHGCFADLEHIVPVPVSVTKTKITPPTTTRSPIPVPQEFIEGRIMINIKSQFNGVYGCLDHLSINQTCNKILQSPVSKFPVIETSTMSKNGTSGVIHSYYCCQNDMCNERGHVAATIQASRKSNKPTIINSIPVDKEQIQIQGSNDSTNAMNVTDIKSNQTKSQNIYNVTAKFQDKIVHFVNEYEKQNAEQTTIVNTMVQEFASSKMQELMNITTVNTTSQENITTRDPLDVATIQPAITIKSKIDGSKNTKDINDNHQFESRKTNGMTIAIFRHFEPMSAKFMVHSTP